MPHAAASFVSALSIIFLVSGFVARGAESILEIEEAQAVPGSSVTVKALLTHEMPVDGFEVILLYDELVLNFTRVELGPALKGLGEIEAFVFDQEHDSGSGLARLSVGVLFDFVPPFDGSGLDPGNRQPILSYHFDVADDPGLVGQCTPLELGASQFLPSTLVNGRICFVEHPIFRRGDCNGDGKVTGQVTDAIFLLSYNFGGGAEPSCLAACDANGDGTVAGEVADAVFLLMFNFLGGPSPPPPFPGCGPGERPSDEALGCSKPCADGEG